MWIDIATYTSMLPASLTVLQTSHVSGHQLKDIITVVRVLKKHPQRMCSEHINIVSHSTQNLTTRSWEIAD